MKWLLFVANSSRTFKTERGSVGGSGRAYNLSRQISMRSMSKFRLWKNVEGHDRGPAKVMGFLKLYNTARDYFKCTFTPHFFNVAIRCIVLI